MIYLLYLSIGAATLCFAILGFLKYISISKMRIDSRDQRKKAHMSTLEVLSFLRNNKPFPISVHTGWKLYSLMNGFRIWIQETSPDNQSASFHMFASFRKVRVSSQMVLQILKDISKSSSWKPGCLATSITSKPSEDDLVARSRGMMGNLPVQHDVVVEETIPEKSGILSSLFCAGGELQTVKKEHTRYWHKEDNGVCWHLQMCEREQEWLFFLAQPVQDVEECLLSVVGYRDNYSHTGTARYISEILGSFSDFVRYRKCVSTNLINIKMPVANASSHPHSYSSSEEMSPGKRMFKRFESFVKRPISGEKLHSVKQQLIRSTWILRHKSPSFMSALSAKQSETSKALKTCSLDRKDMPNLKQIRSSGANNTVDETFPVTHDVHTQNGIKNATNEDVNKNEMKSEIDENESSVSSNEDNENVNRDVEISRTKEKVKDIDHTLDADVNDHEQFEQTSTESQMSGTKENINSMVCANQTAAELIAVALQASNIDLSASLQEQVMNSGGWMFCGLENDVVILKKVSIKDNTHCYLGKGAIQASPITVWNAIRNPRTKFTYDESLKKVDVIEKMADSIKLVYYYHEVLQLFKTECYDMVVTQSERVDRGDKYVLSMQSSDKGRVVSPAHTTRVKVLPSGWIVEPLPKDKKIFSMVTYIMQIEQGDGDTNLDKNSFEDFIAKQPLSIAYLRQYLKGCVYQK